MTHNKNNHRSYIRSNSIVFRKTNERFGGLSNMAAGFPVNINGISIRTVEALYQACRYPNLPEIQARIIEEKSPMAAKMKGKPYRNQTRSDWDNVKVNIMRWCLRVKLVQNWDKFGELLVNTGTLPIVEESKRDDFWGAKPINDEDLVGVNALGRLLMELREEFKKFAPEINYIVNSLSIPNFILYGEPIIDLSRDEFSINIIEQTKVENVQEPEQLNFFINLKI